MSIIDPPNRAEAFSIFEQLAEEFKKPAKQLTERERSFVESGGRFDLCFSKKEFKHFCNNLCWFFSTEMDKHKADAKKASERLKRTHEGKEPDDE